MPDGDIPPTVETNYDKAFSQWFADTVFLMDTEQLYNVYHNDANLGGNSYYISDDMVDYLLRTPFYIPGNPYNYNHRIIFVANYIDLGRILQCTLPTNNLRGVRPAFFLNADMEFSGSGEKDSPYTNPNIPSIFNKGDGTEANPYIIPDLATLEKFRDKVLDGETYENKHFKLTADIDMSEKYGDGKANWTPIGNDTNQFKGIFDGGNHSISEIYINGKDYQGLFGYSAGIIRNVTVSGQAGVWSRIGGICGHNSGSIENCANMCNVSIENIYEFYAGGICGYNNGTVRNCFNSGVITTNGGQNGSLYKGCGGICGYNSGEISNCYNIGSVTDKSNHDKTGGICGDGQTEKIKNCYYLNTCGAAGAGTAKTAEAFASGEVTNLLQSGQDAQIWGQTAGSGYPELTTDSAKNIYKVTFTVNGTEYAAAYANPNGTVTLPTASTPDDGYEFYKWSHTNSADGEEFTASTPITEDITIYAIFSLIAEPTATPTVEPTATPKATPTVVPTATTTVEPAATPTAKPTDTPKATPTTKPYYGSGSSRRTTPKPTATPRPTTEPTMHPTEADKPISTDKPSDNWFTDVPENAWYYNSVKYVFENGLMLGVSDTEFKPLENITRGMFVTVLYRMENEPKINSQSTFTDIDGAYYTDAVEWAHENKIVAGYSDELFAPEENITREQTAAIVYRYSKFKEYDTDINDGLSYSDSSDISDYAKDAVIWNSKHGIMIGNEDNTFSPVSNTTRAQAAAVFERIVKNLK